MGAIEVLTFRLADHGADAAFLEADARLQTSFSYQQPGLVRRTTARATDGEWVVLTVWGSDADADAAAAEAADHPVVKEFDAFVDPATVQRARYSTLD